MKQEAQNMEMLIGKTLRWGAFLSAFVALIGGVVYVFQQQTIPDYRDFTGASPSLRSFSGILSGVFSGDGASIIQLSVCLLIATPILRLILALWSFIVEKDRLYVCITLIVLGVIFFGMLSGLGG